MNQGIKAFTASQLWIFGVGLLCFMLGSCAAFKRPLLPEVQALEPDLPDELSPRQKREILEEWDMLFRLPKDLVNQ